MKRLLALTLAACGSATGCTSVIQPRLEEWRTIRCVSAPDP